MADYHTVYKGPDGTSTEWDDLQVKFGNREAREKPQLTPWEPAESRRPREDGTLEGLEELEDSADDDRFMEEYRLQRISELKAAAAQPRFGSVELIKGADFVREVTDSSRDVWVVAHLFKDGVPACALLGQCLAELAQKFPGTKFVRIVSTECIPRYPDANLPTLLVYKGGQVKETLVGLRAYSVPGERGGGGSCSPEGVALALCRIGPVLAGDGESEEEVLERVGRDVVRGMVERCVARTGGSDDESE